MIHMKNVSKAYPNKVIALERVNVDINKGEFVFIVGSSGAGKSTFIKLLLREELPTFGEIEVNGRDVVNMPQAEVPYLRRGLGVIFQDYRLLPDKTVFENVAFDRSTAKNHAEKREFCPRYRRLERSIQGFS